MNNTDHNENSFTNILRIDNKTTFGNIGKQKVHKFVICQKIFTFIAM